MPDQRPSPACPAPDWFDLYLDGALPATQAHSLEAHVAVCATCAAHLAGLRQVFQALDGLPDAPLERDLSQVVLAQLAALPPKAAAETERLTPLAEHSPVGSGPADALLARPHRSPRLVWAAAFQALAAVIVMALALPWLPGWLDGLYSTVGARLQPDAAAWLPDLTLRWPDPAGLESLTALAQGWEALRSQVDQFSLQAVYQAALQSGEQLLAGIRLALSWPARLPDSRFSLVELAILLATAALSGWAGNRWLLRSFSSPSYPPSSSRRNH